MNSKILCEIKPDIVINCIGIVKSLVNVVPLDELYYINSIFPYTLSKITSEKKIDLIHFSTDCVFSGKTGNYKESDFADSQDSYGRSKFYGEVQNENTLVFRISVIGRELTTNRGLIEWFLQQQDVDGFLNAIFLDYRLCQLETLSSLLNFLSEKDWTFSFISRPYF